MATLLILLKEQNALCFLKEKRVIMKIDIMLAELNEQVAYHACVNEKN
jgi:hypothetical protein